MTSQLALDAPVQVQAQAGPLAAPGQHDSLPAQASNVAQAAQPALQLVATLTPSETDYYQHKAQDGKFYVITHNTKVNGMVVSCRATRDVWQKHALALEAAGLLKAGMNAVIDIQEDGKVFVNNTETAQVASSIANLQATSQAICDYSKGSPLGAPPPITPPLQPLDHAASIEVLERLTALKGHFNAPSPAAPSEQDAREARKLLEEMSRINHAAVNLYFPSLDVPNPTPEQTQALIADIKIYLSQLIANYNTHMRATYTNPCEAADVPTGVNNAGNNCFLATAVVLHQQNKVLKAACGTLENGHPWHADNQDLNALRTRILPQSPVGAQEDAHEFMLALHKQMTINDDGSVTVDGIDTPFSKQYSTLVDGVARQESIQGNPHFAPIFEMSFDETVIAANGTPSIEDLLFPDGKEQLEGQTPATILIHATRAVQGGGTRTAAIDAPLYCTAQALFRLQDDGAAAEHYTLQGFSSHTLGSSAQGHYVTYLQHNGLFYKINGPTVTPVLQEEYLKKARTASILNYSKVQARPPA